MGNFHFDVIPYRIISLPLILFLLFLFLIWVFICHGIIPECSGLALGSASHVPKIIPRN